MDSYWTTKDVALLDEAAEISSRVLVDGPPSEVPHAFLILAQIHLIPDCLHLSTSTALRYLDLSFEGEVPDVDDLLCNISYTLSSLWDLSNVWKSDTARMLCDVYIKVIDRLSLIASFVLDHHARIQGLTSTRHIGTDACVTAVLADQPTKAVELLDRAHGFVWTQALHQRDVQMEGVPPELAVELAVLLRAVSALMPTHPTEPSSSAEYRTLRHEKGTRIHDLLREIRTKPGLARFMLGSTYETLREAARSHPVVVLVAGRGHALALIMSSAEEDEPHVLRLGLTSDDLSRLRTAAGKADLRSAAADARSQEPDVRLGLRPDTAKSMREPHKVLANLWRCVVKPIVDHLGLQVPHSLG
jgi:hypothetical protein